MGNKDMVTDSDTAMPKPHRAKRILADISHSVVLLLSLALIGYISYDTFENIPFLEDHRYMTFQFWVCILFLGDFFIEFFLSQDKRRYLKRRWLFFFISIPYLNIIHQYGFTFNEEILFYLRFVPLLRGTYSLAMVLGYISHNRAVSLMWQYFSILIVLVYSLTLVFYYQEHAVNPDVKSFWDALYWAAMNTTTVGCYFSAVTPVGKVISIILPTAGMLMLPLFTAFITSKVHTYDSQEQNQEQNQKLENVFYRLRAGRHRMSKPQEGTPDSQIAPDSDESAPN